MMKKKSTTLDFIHQLLFCAAIFGLIFFGQTLAGNADYFRYYHFFLLFLGAAITFVSPERGLYILILVSMFSPEIILDRIGRRYVTVRFDDIMVVLSILTWLIIRIIKKNVKFLISTPLDKPILFFVLICALSTARGVLIRQVESPLAGFFYVLKMIEYFIIFYLVVNTITNKLQVRRSVFIFLITLIFTILFGYHQMQGGVTRVSTPFEDQPEPNTMGGYLLFMFGIATSLAISGFKVINKYFLFFILPFLIWIFLHTLSRGSYLGYFPVLICLIVILPRNKRIYGVIILAASIFAIPYLPNYITVRIENTFKGRDQFKIPVLGEEKTIRLDSSSSSRIHKMKNIMRYWEEYPLFGLGITGAGFIDSMVFRILGELGLMGIFSIVYLFSTIFSETINSYKYSRNSLNKGLCIGYICGTVGLLVHSTTANTLFLIRIMTPFWYLTGLIFLIPRIYFDEMSKPVGKNLFLELEKESENI